MIKFKKFITGLAILIFSQGVFASNPEPLPPVVFIHGILANPLIFLKMEHDFKESGYTCYAYGYASRTKGIHDHAVDFASWLEENIGDQEFYLVSHSLGNLVSREMLAMNPEMKIKRWVMVAPPNKGADAADFFNRLPIYKVVTGESGQELLASKVQDYMNLPSPSVPFAIIAGGLKNNKGFNPLLNGDNDGVVRVEETYLDGAKDYIIVPHQHSIMLFKKDVIQQTQAFLETGSFIH